MKTYSLSIALFILVLVAPYMSVAQDNVAEKYQNKYGETNFVSFRPDALPSLEQSKQILHDFFGVDKSETLHLLETNTTKGGTTHYQYSQYSHGYPVINSYLAIHVKNNKITSVNGDWAKIGEVNTNLQLTEQQALRKALEDIGAKTYKWQINAEELNLKSITNNKSATYLPKGELVVIRDYFLTDRVYRLAYKFDIYAHQPLSRYYIYVDAITGSILFKDSRIKTTNSPGTADTRYSATRNITTDSFTGGYKLSEVRGPSSVTVSTLNMRTAGGYYSSATDFTDNDNTWSASEYNNSNNDNAALDVHWATEVVHDYWRNVWGRNSWNNSGGSLLSYVNADLPAINSSNTNSDNAFWDGSRMTYGQGTNMQPLVSLDVVAHEIGHALCDNLVQGIGLAYSNQSGALEESLSDIWGAVIENTSVTGKQTWIMADDVLSTGIRSMSSPHNSLTPQPDSYLGTHWYTGSNDNGGVHINSGVMNRWFYLITQGGSGFNDGSTSSASSGTPWSVNGIGITDAAMVVFLAEDNYFGPYSNYSDARNHTIQAARDAFGVGSCQEIAVTNAWNAVGLGTAFGYPSTTISGSDLVCSTTTYTLSNQPAGTTVTWASDNPYVLTINPSTGEATKVGNGIATVIAYISTNCATISIPITKKVHAGTPTITSISMNTQMCTGNSQYIVATISGNPSYLHWYISSGNAANAYLTDYSNGSASFNTYNADCYGLTLDMSNACGSSNDGTTICADNCFSAYKIYPNPAKDYLTIEFEKVNKIESLPDQIELLNESSNKPLLTVNVQDEYANNKLLNGTTLSLNVKDLPRGTYYLHVKNSRRQDNPIDKIRIILE